MTGPLILITLGVLFLLNNLDPARFQFGRMWPVILIVIGLVKIFEYFGRSGSSDDRRASRLHGPGALHMETHVPREDPPSAEVRQGRAEERR